MLTLGCMFAAPNLAAQQYKSVVVREFDGSVTAINIEEKMTASFDWNEDSYDFVISTRTPVTDAEGNPVLDDDGFDKYETKVYLSLPAIRVKSMELHENDITGVAPVPADADMLITPDFLNNSIRVERFADRIPVAVHSLDGALQAAFDITSPACVDLSAYAPGIYIVTIGSRTLKYYVK